MPMFTTPKRLLKSDIATVNKASISVDNNPRNERIPKDLQRLYDLFNLCPEHVSKRSQAHGSANSPDAKAFDKTVGRQFVRRFDN